MTRARRLLPLFLAIPILLILLGTVPAVQKFATPAPIIMEELMRQAAEAPPAPGVVHYNISYRRTVFREQKLDIYEPTVAFTKGEAPVVIFFHGGSWIKGDKVTIRVIDRFLNRMREQGYFVVAPNYTTTLFRGLQGPLDNTKAAVQWVVENGQNYGYDPDNIGLYGVSAGGHLALLAGSTMESPSFSLFLIECAPTDLVAMRSGDAYDSSWVFKLLPEERLRALSPITYVDRELPPILIYHGTADRVVHIDQSIRYTRAAVEAGAEVELVRYVGGNHAFLNYTDEQWYEQESRALAFMAEHF